MIITTARERLGLSQTRYGALFNLSGSVVSRRESGESLSIPPQAVTIATLIIRIAMVEEAEALLAVLRETPSPKRSEESQIVALVLFALRRGHRGILEEVLEVSLDGADAGAKEGSVKAMEAVAGLLASLQGGLRKTITQSQSERRRDLLQQGSLKLAEAAELLLMADEESV